MNKDDYKKFIGKRIRESREQLKLTREQLSELCDIEPSFLSAVENGQKSMTLYYFKKICVALHISADYILGIETENNNDTSLLMKYISNMNEEDFKCTENIIIVKVSKYNKAEVSTSHLIILMHKVYTAKNNML